MGLFLSTVWQSLLHRRMAIGMTMLSIFMSVYLLIAIEHLRGQSQENFKNTVSGVDLLVGPRGSETNLLLYSVFQIGFPSVNISWDTYAAMKQHPQVDWTIPISLGDSHKGFRVVGTTDDYFKHYRYGRKQNLAFQQKDHEHHDHDHKYDNDHQHDQEEHHGHRIQTENQANNIDFHGTVIGAYVAQKLNYQVGQKITLSHGLSEASFHHHDDHPINIQAILEPTGTPVDKLLLVPLNVIETIHEPVSNKPSSASQSKTSFSAGYLSNLQQSNAPKQEEHDHHDHKAQGDHDHSAHKTPENITAFMLGLKNKMMTFQVQHYLNNYKPEALTATLPGVALTQLWQSMNIMENTLRSIAVLVLIASLIGMSATLLAGMDARKQELKILRTMGAHPRFVFSLILTEGFLITFMAIALALLALLISIPIANQYLIQYLGMTLSFNFLSLSTGVVLIVILLASLLMSCIPAWSAYRKVLV